MTREEAIQRFKGIINSMSISVAQSKFYPSKAELNELCDMAIEALSADRPKGEWIPVSERLPREYAQYLVCFKTGHCYVYWLEDSDWARGMAEKEGVLAWMPLPEPYKGGDKE